MALMSPPASSKVTTKVMKANRWKNTGPELILRKALRDAGYPGYRINWKKAPGRPDITFPGKKIAIFVNGCFWHRCPHCNLPLPKTHLDYWEKKFQMNVQRDAKNIEALESMGWVVITVWECEIHKDLSAVVDRICKTLASTIH
ncbi:MAG: very short patch repair endonuclease [Candidatus Methanomethylophilus sp.]|nr:very short patch repair endonuclease [Methanomethylophilus sp.]